MAFAIGSPPASREARAPTPADELLRMRLQAVEAVEFRGTALLGAEPSPRQKVARARRAADAASLERALVAACRARDDGDAGEAAAVAGVVAQSDVAFLCLAYRRWGAVGPDLGGGTCDDEGAWGERAAWAVWAAAELDAAKETVAASALARRLVAAADRNERSSTRDLSRLREILRLLRRLVEASEGAAEDVLGSAGGRRQALWTLSNVLECGDAEIVREAQTLLKSFLGE